MVGHRCRYCGNPIEIPQYFSPAQQRVFEFIWKNPGCTIKDMMIGVYGRELITNVLGIHMMRIRKGLAGTGYRMTHVLATHYARLPHATNAPRKYFIEPSIEKLAEARPTEGIADVAT
jgi:hypothetical protein